LKRKCEDKSKINPLKKGEIDEIRRAASSWADKDQILLLLDLREDQQSTDADKIANNQASSDAWAQLSALVSYIFPTI